MRIRSVSTLKSGRISGHGFISGRGGFLLSAAHATSVERARHTPRRISPSRRPDRPVPDCCSHAVRAIRNCHSTHQSGARTTYNGGTESPHLVDRHARDFGASPS